MFSPEASKGDKPSLIPDKTLAFAVVTVKGIGNSKRTGGTYANLELTIADGPYTGRKVFTIVCDPTDSRNVNEEARRATPPKPDGAKMGLTALTRAFEACRLFDPANPATYRRLDGMDFSTILSHLAGKTIAVKVKIEKGSDGYDDKNTVGEWLSPNPDSGGHVGWKSLIGGQGAVQQARAGAFGAPAPAAPVVAQAPAFGAPTQAFPTSVPAVANRPAWIDEAKNNNAPF